MISIKEFSKDFVTNVIENEDKYYNCSQYYTSDFYYQYKECKIDYLSAWTDYCLEYKVYDDDSKYVSVFGFAKKDNPK